MSQDRLPNKNTLMDQTSSNEADVKPMSIAHHHDQLVPEYQAPETDVQSIKSETKKQYKNKLAYYRSFYREYFGEFLGTMMLVLLGDGVNAQKTLSGGDADNYTNITIAWGCAVLFGWLISVGAGAGGHLNPAVTTAFSLFRGFPARKVAGYIGAQMLGGFIGALLVYGTYKEAFKVIDPEKTMKTAGIFSTYPQDFLNTKGQVASELVAGAVLIITILSMADLGNDTFFPIGLYLCINVIGCSLGWQTGYAMNPARDLAPRVAARAVGYGSFTFTTSNSYSWVPSIIPFIATALGSAIYDILIYEGEDSPLNKPYYGFEFIFDKEGRKQRKQEQELAELKVNV